MSVKARRRFWTDADRAKLVRMYPDTPTAFLARLLRRSERSVYGQATLLGLQKSERYLRKELQRQGERLRKHGAASRFRKGQKPWNAGTHFVAGGRSGETRFKVGSQPHNTRPVGDYRLSKDGLLQRKIGTAKGNNSKRWRCVHELVWIAAHGPVPPGHIVVFRRGMRTTRLDEITPDRVECVSYAENMRRNSYHRYPQPIPQLIQLRGALNRQINQRAG
jgi:hypothetical protein